METGIIFGTSFWRKHKAPDFRKGIESNFTERPIFGANLPKMQILVQMECQRIAPWYERFLLRA